MIPTPTVPFSNGTEQEAWTDKWCGYCVHDHDMHTGDGGGCELFLVGAMLAGTDEWRWPEAWLPEPDDGQFALPSRMICAMFKPCNKGDCMGDPGAEPRTKQITEVTAYWRNRRTELEP
jgi:hypothetical protein